MGISHKHCGLWLSTALRCMFFVQKLWENVYQHHHRPLWTIYLDYLLRNSQLTISRPWIAHRNLGIMYSQFGVGPCFTSVVHLLYLCCTRGTREAEEEGIRGTTEGQKMYSRGTRDEQQRYNRGPTPNWEYIIPPIHFWKGNSKEKHECSWSLSPATPMQAKWIRLDLALNYIALARFPGVYWNKL